MKDTHKKNNEKTKKENRIVDEEDSVGYLIY